MRALFTAVLALMFPGAVVAQEIDRRAELLSPPGVYEAYPGEVVLNFRVTSALPNIFGAADIFGRRKEAGSVVVQFAGVRDGSAVFYRQDVIINSGETTMTRTPLFIPSQRNTQFEGQIGRQDFSGSSTSHGMIVVPPRPQPGTSVATTPIEIMVPRGGRMRVEGRMLTVQSVSADGVIVYDVR
jgi:hypothetical protein